LGWGIQTTDRGTREEEVEVEIEVEVLYNAQMSDHFIER